jgi:hypothetical protein
MSVVMVMIGSPLLCERGIMARPDRTADFAGWRSSLTIERVEGRGGGDDPTGDAAFVGGAGMVVFVAAVAPQHDPR